MTHSKLARIEAGLPDEVHEALEGTGPRPRLCAACRKRLAALNKDELCFGCRGKANAGLVREFRTRSLSLGARMPKKPRKQGGFRGDDAPSAKNREDG
jgi:hypothetical protein